MLSLWRDRHDLPDYLIAPLQKTVEMMADGRASGRPYLRIALATNVQLYRAAGPRIGKSLLVCFCGNVNRLMVPIPVLLQFIPETMFDVVIVKDPSRQGYIHGVPGFADSLAAAVDAIGTRINLAAYADIRCIGTSGGGSAALYAGLLLGASRAISVCGRHRSLPNRAAGEPDGETFTGFEFDDMVRDRIEDAATRLLLVFGQKYPRDVEGAQSLKRYLPKAQAIAIKPLDDHNALLYLLREKKLRGFLERFLFNSLPAQIEGR